MAPIGRLIRAGVAAEAAEDEQFAKLALAEDSEPPVAGIHWCDEERKQDLD